MPSVSIIYRKDKINKKGEAPIHFRIIKNRKISYISSGIMLLEASWDFKHKKVKPKHPNSPRLNSFLANKFTELQDQVFEHETLTKSSTTKQLKEKIYGKSPTDFFAFADEACQQYLNINKISTYDKSRSIIQKLRDYHKSNRLDFQDITLLYLTKYENYLRNTQGNKTNTIHTNLKFIRKLFNDACKIDLIDYSHNPFRRYELKTEKTQRTFLTEEELQTFADVPTETGSRLDLHKDMFIFAAYVGGLRVSDVLLLKWENFNEEHIHFIILKTGNQLSIKLPNIAINIINKYRLKEPNKQAFIFPTK